MKTPPFPEPAAWIVEHNGLRQLAFSNDGATDSLFTFSQTMEFARAYYAVNVAHPTEAAPTSDGWIDPHEELPPLGEQVLVYSRQSWEKEPSLKLDTWDEQHEAPLSWSSAMIPIGPGWNDHDDFESVIRWKRTTPPEVAAPTPKGEGEGRE